MKHTNTLKPIILLLGLVMLAGLAAGCSGAAVAQTASETPTPVEEPSTTAEPAEEAPAAEESTEPAAAPEIDADFVGFAWQWQETASNDDTTLTVDDPSLYTVEFSADGTVAIQADCNLASGSYTVDGASLSINIGPMTLAACPPDSLSDQFIQQLGFAGSYVMEDGAFIINLVADAGNMIFAGVVEDVDDGEEEEGEDVIAPVFEAPAVFRTLLPAEEGVTRLLTLAFAEDDTVELITENLDGGELVVESGTWELAEDGTVTVTFPGEGDEPNVVVLEVGEDGLTAREYDVTLYGNRGLALREYLETHASSAKRAFVTVDLEAGFVLDPFLVSVNGGGELDASVLGEGCSGFVHEDPVVSLDWEGESDFVEAFFFSDHDPTLIVQTPDGEFLCNDDANALLLDPVIEISDPEKGIYNIWVGSYHPDQLIPGVLVLTTKPEVNLGTFALGSLITRDAIPEVLQTAEGQVAAEALIEALRGYEGDTPELTPDSDAVSVEVVGEGDIPAFEIPMADARCSGFITGIPELVFDWSGEAKQLNILFEGDADASLVVVAPGDGLICDDDAVEGENVNPLVSIGNPEKGRYAVFVGRLNVDEPLSGDLIVTSAAGVQPDVLAVPVLETEAQ